MSFRPTIAFFIGLLAISANNSLCLAQTEGNQETTIIVIGKRNPASRKETKRTLSTGSSTTIIPKEASRFESKDLLKKDSSLSFKETGRMNTVGFTVPNIRGQDAKLTEIYIDEVLIQSPYTGMPSTYDLDLRAFGKIDLFQGISSYTIPSTNPIGALRYRKVPQKFNHQLGTSYGIPHGSTVWTSNRQETKYSNSQIDSSLYTRFHSTNGKFDYYNDNGTPYKTSDDFEANRKNNHRRSWQLLPYIEYSDQKWTLSLMGISHHAESGLTGPISSEGLSTENTFDQFADIEAEYRLGSFNSLVPYSISLGANNNINKRNINDPIGDLLGFASTNALTTESNALSSRMEHKGSIYDNKIQISQSQSKIAAHSSAFANFEFTRQSTSLYWGGSIDLYANLLLEYKLSWLDIVDKDNIKTTKRGSAGKNLSSSYRTKYSNSYLQYGLFERIPTLFEEFGDGGYVKSADSLATEKMTHKEVGTILHNKSTSQIIGLAYFEDDTANKIRFLPSFGQTLKAQNLDSTKISGLNIFAELSYETFGGSLTISQLKAEDLSFEASKSIVNIPEFKGVLSAYKSWNEFILRWTTNQRSKVYRDRNNSIEIPAARTHDLNADYSIQSFSQKIALGIAILNVFDLKKIGISAPDSPTNNGATGYSDYYGFPLPGRNFKATVNWQL